MFFRRERARKLTFAERMENLQKAGLTLKPAAGDSVIFCRGNCAMDLKEVGGTAIVCRAGILMGEEIGALVDGGFQKFFRTPTGRSKPALAGELEALHAFEEDVGEVLGQESLYNQSLGTTSTFHPYDRVQDRDRGVPKRVWE